MNNRKFYPGQTVFVSKKSDTCYHNIPLFTRCVVIESNNILDDVVYRVRPLDTGGDPQWMMSYDLLPTIKYLSGQMAQVFDWIHSGGISLRESITYLNVMSLTKVISLLKDAGVPIEIEKAYFPGVKKATTIYRIPAKDTKWVRVNFKTQR